MFLLQINFYSMVFPFSILQFKFKLLSCLFHFSYLLFFVVGSFYGFEKMFRLYFIVFRTSLFNLLLFNFLPDYWIFILYLLFFLNKYIYILREIYIFICFMLWYVFLTSVAHVFSERCNLRWHFLTLFVFKAVWDLLPSARNKAIYLKKIFHGISITSLFHGPI